MVSSSTKLGSLQQQGGGAHITFFQKDWHCQWYTQGRDVLTQYDNHLTSDSTAHFYDWAITCQLNFTHGCSHQLRSAGFLHCLLGHIGVKGLQHAAKRMDFNDSNLSPCSVCVITNIKCTPFPYHLTHHATKLLQHIHCNICGPLSSCYGSYKYFILFICCYLCYITVHFMKSWEEALECLKIEFHSITETFCSKKTTIYYVDNAPC